MMDEIKEKGDEWSWLLNNSEFCIVAEPNHPQKLFYALAFKHDTSLIVGRGFTPENAISCWRYWSEKLT